MTHDEFVEAFQKHEGLQRVKIVKTCGSSLSVWITKVNIVDFHGKTFANAHLSLEGPSGKISTIVVPESIREILV